MQATICRGFFFSTDNQTAAPSGNQENPEQELW
jgi:hypothetical protein